MKHKAKVEKKAEKAAAQVKVSNKLDGYGESTTKKCRIVQPLDFWVGFEMMICAGEGKGCI